MSRARAGAGPVKAWIEPDRWAFVRAFPFQATVFVLVTVASVALAFAVHPLFWALSVVAMFRQATAEASLRELWREGMLHPALVVRGARGFLATLVRLESEAGVQDAVVISRIPRRWGKLAPPWGGERAAVVIAGQPPKLRPLSPDFAVRDLSRARRAIERIPEAQWEALRRALRQVGEPTEGLHPVQLGQAPWYGALSDIEVDGSWPEQVPAQNDIWCCGLPCIEQPAMADAERARVVGFRARALRRSLLWGGLGFGLPAAFFVGMWSTGRSASELGPWLSFAGFCTLLVAPFFLLSAIASFSRLRAYRRDLAAGHLLRFSGVLSSFDSLALDPDLAALTRRGMFVLEPGLEQDMCVLPASNELLHANGKWARPGSVLHVERVAVPPESPIKLPLPADVEAQVASAVSVARRRLTTSEIAELERHAERLKRPSQVFWFLAALALLALISWHGQSWSWPPKPVSIPVALAAFFMSVLTLLRRSRLAARLLEDAELGWVLTVDHDESHPEGDLDLPAHGVETLLHTRLDWTVNRRPATWRRFGGRREG